MTTSTLSIHTAQIGFMSTLKQRITEAVKAGFKKAELARAAGVTSSAVSQWLSSETAQLKSTSAAGLAKHTKWSYEWWVSGKGPREPDGPKELHGDFSDRREASESDWALLTAVKVAMTEQERQDILRKADELLAQAVHHINEAKK